MVITFKSPDSVSDAIDEYMGENPGADRKAIEAAVDKFVEWREYVSIDIDLETGKAKVLPA